MSEMKEFKIWIESMISLGVNMDYTCKVYTEQKKKHWWKRIPRTKAYDIIRDIYTKYEKN